MPDDLRYLSAQLEIEHNRLRSFTAAAGLIDREEGSLPTTIRDRAPLILPILAEIKLVLKQLAGGESPPQAPVNNTTTMSSQTGWSANLHGGLPAAAIELSYPSLEENLGSTNKLTTKLKWSLSERDNYTQWLRRLQDLNDSLYDLLDEHQVHMLRDEQRQTYMELLQMRSSVDDLRTLAQAAHARQQESAARPAWQQIQNVELSVLASFKALYTSLLDETLKDRSSLLIPAAHIQLRGEPSSAHGLQRAEFVSSNQVSKEVWITWHHQQPPNSGMSNLQLSMIEELTALLKANKPDEFRIPPCLGYSILAPIEDQQPKVAIVFERPPYVPSHVRPINLLQALQMFPRPSLSQRIALSQSISKCLLYWHSVNWLHKAIRSEVILLFQSDNDDLQLGG